MAKAHHEGTPADQSPDRYPLPSMGRLPRLQIRHVFHEVQDAGYGPLGQRLGVDAGRRRHHGVPACQAGPSHKLADPGAGCL
jgi:hypothetical protein